MRRQSLAVAALLGGLTSLPLMAVSYLGQQVAGLPFVPFDLFDWLARVLPGNVITVGIDTIVRVIQVFNLGPISNSAKRIEQSLGILLVIAGCAVIAMILAALLRRVGWSGWQLGGIIGLLAALPLIVIENSLAASSQSYQPGVTWLWLLFLVAAWGACLGAALRRVETAATPAPAASRQSTALQSFKPRPGEPAVLTRRQLLAGLAAGSVGLALASWGLGRLFATQKGQSGAGQALSQLVPTAPQPGPSATPIPLQTPVGETPGAETMRGRVPAAPGTRPELTPTDRFYRIDIDTLPPVMSQDTWELQVSGLFDHPRTLRLSDLLAFPAVTQPITLSCISNPIGGDLISTGNWTGPRLRDVMMSLGLRPEARSLAITAADGFYEAVEMADIMDPRTLLVYGMNGDTLPVEHGYPLRIYIPNRYGMKQPKWIIAIAAIDHQGPGYWVDRGWSAEARPQIISIIDTVAKDHIENGRVPVGGIAWAGDRGIQKVEVQVDDGPWDEAILRTPPLGPLTWIEWRYDWPAVRGRHTFRVRATDGAGALQISTPADTYPDGATGYHSVTATI